METTATLSGLLGVPPDQVTAALSDIAGTPIDPSTITINPFPYAYGSPTTGGLWRVSGDGWSMFVKQLHHVRHWPGLAHMPPHIAATFADELPWRTETELWDPRIQASLPDGLRSPILHRLVELGDDRIALWQEDVAQSPVGWDIDRYALAAYRLGSWNARSMAPEVLAVSDFPAGFALRMYAERAVTFRGLGPLRSDELWDHPWLREHGDLRADLLELGARIPELLDRLDGFPQALPHGDASPQNLLVPSGGGADFVVIDLSFRTPHALGFDLGQLLVGLVHAGETPASSMPAISAAIVPAYLDGLGVAGVTGLDQVVREGFATSVLLRSGFDGFLYDVVGDDGSRHAFDERVAMARFLLEQYRTLKSLG
ncbi:hypothetical protein FB565_006740 [Actinoplanes lutulentus]|uniref:Phosphotransferase family enzyme n=1 Tax=Actinoplanes lutulentus TaxID=1287878 RepID=A0A327Z708_9ACTN|nr:hypothetical protein [Actinoplanes lutulentus]MBB2946972.1 hypothetical protein [Actinoplanes lutulentus]RAK30474.1 hypothetical protein B0I29_116133 [Actinoplanes lutulentus]